MPATFRMIPSLVAAVVSNAVAQSYPSKPIRMFVPAGVTVG